MVRCNLYASYNKNSLLTIQQAGVPKVGFEPTRAYAHYALNVARLPIPPLRLARLILPHISCLSIFVGLAKRKSRGS
jgi:hypothetical protein